MFFFGRSTAIEVKSRILSILMESKYAENDTNLEYLPHFRFRHFYFSPKFYLPKNTSVFLKSDWQPKAIDPIARLSKVQEYLV
jgi:hypothetical protein